MRTVVFDLDGTLVDTSGDLIAAGNACFRDMGLGDLLDPARDQKTAVRGARAMLRLGLERAGQLDDAVVDAQFQPLLDHYARAISTHTTLYPGAMAAVDALTADGYRVAICTNKPLGLTQQLLTALGIDGRFHAVLGADSTPTPKPHAGHLIATVQAAGGDMARCLLVGDTETDAKTAAAAGVPAVLVTFGPAGADMAALRPAALLDHFDDLPAVVRNLIG
ncbi:phosphoglycolate phosphatase [Loktanella fryxellensis]|uniref:phosphoglycolate phosphatase n=1 Tax=Loktanella fryxellensis TaxID=245187 RepID=A0A1H8BLD7_9RHOB|nr:HAD-IA family hydrolase [Loktanella fryxellensis]SEM83675.1 phosphoglycolate phosphatase [Loktanella fryxellensis]